MLQFAFHGECIKYMNHLTPYLLFPVVLATAEINTIKNEWALMHSIAFEVPVTTTALKSGNNVFIPCGEIRAGVRTPQILMGIIV